MPCRACVRGNKRWRIFYDFGHTPSHRCLQLFYRGWALTPRDLFDWWVIESRMPSVIPSDGFASLLNAKRDELNAALDALATSAAARAAWGAILVPAVPDIGVIAAWGKAALQRYFQT